MYHVGGNVYELVRDNKNGWNLEVFRNRYSEVLDRYDYVVGDWGYSQLRLRGFFKEGNPRSTKDSIISGFEDYINEYCNFGCAYFILEKIGQTDRPDDRDPLVEEAELAEAAERAAGRIGEDGILRAPAPERPVRHDRYNRGGVEVRGGRAVRPDKSAERASGGGERAADGRSERNSDREYSSSDRERNGGRQERRGGGERDRGAQASVSSQRSNAAGGGGAERADRSDRRHKERRSGADASRPDRKGDGNRRPRRPGSGGGSGGSGGGEAAQQHPQGHKDRQQQHAQQQQHPQRKNPPSGDSSSN